MNESVEQEVQGGQPGHPAVQGLSISPGSGQVDRRQKNSDPYSPYRLQKALKLGLGSKDVHNDLAMPLNLMSISEDESINSDPDLEIP